MVSGCGAGKPSADDDKIVNVHASLPARSFTI
jgi:hypothetical protein